MNIKNCKNCHNEMLYNEHYHMFECNTCGKTYNAMLQELRPLRDWQNEYDGEDY